MGFKTEKKKEKKTLRTICLKRLIKLKEKSKIKYKK